MTTPVALTVIAFGIAALLAAGILALRFSGTGQRCTVRGDITTRPISIRVPPCAKPELLLPPCFGSSGKPVSVIHHEREVQYP